jgi:hypothetical protein
MLQARERTLIPSSSIICTFEFAFESFKEFGGASHLMPWIIASKLPLVTISN